MGRVSIGPGKGKVTDARTAAMLDAAQKLAGMTFSYSQGSYSGGVSASAGTHAGGGAVDIRTIPMGSTAAKMRAVRSLRRVGFAAWFRPYRPGVWGEHIHAIALGCPDLSWSAQRQASAYRDGRDGLSGNGPDPQGYMGIRPVTWEQWKARPTVSFANLGRGKPAHQDVKIVQRALNYGLDGADIPVTGVWDDVTHAAWLRARTRFGKASLSLLGVLGARFGFRAAP